MAKEPKAKVKEYRVERGFWTEEEKVMPGTIIELTAEDAIDLVEKGIVSTVGK